VIASALADAIGPRTTVAILGGVAVLWAAVWFLLSRDARTIGLDGGEPEPKAGTEPVPTIS
jgi:hypothetical protein